jgi:hypothetical protein
VGVQERRSADVTLTWVSSPRHRGDSKPNWWLKEKNSMGYLRTIASVCPSQRGQWWVMRIADTAESKSFDTAEDAKAYAVARVRLT